MIDICNDLATLYSDQDGVDLVCLIYNFTFFAVQL